MKIRALLVAMSVATVLTGCQNMDSNGLLSSGAEAFQAYSLSDAQVKTLSDQALAAVSSSEIGARCICRRCGADTRPAGAGSGTDQPPI